MAVSLFSAVKRAVAVDPERILPRLGVELKTSIHGTWTQCVCPLCDDRSGSASITPEGFLRCHQCSRKADLFRWLAEKTGKRGWDLCKELGDQLNVQVPMAKGRRTGVLPARMNQDTLNLAIHALWDEAAAEPARLLLRERKLDADPGLLAELGVGFLSGYIVFAQRMPGGQVLERYRGYLPGATSSHRWRWFGKGTGGVGFWPHPKPPEDAPLWLLEGEWDVLTAWTRLRLQDQGIYAYTWTAGAGSSPSPKDVPSSWAHHTVHVCYDNDTFQGPDYERYQAPNDKGRIAMKTRRQNVLTKVCPVLAGVGCSVFMHAVPIDPIQQWGADFRDWVDAGGRDPMDLPGWAFEELPELDPPFHSVSFSEVLGMPGGEVRFRTQVESIRGDDLVVPKVMRLQCQLGMLPCCSTCKAPTRFSDALVHGAEFPREMAIALASRDAARQLVRLIVEPPRGCPSAELLAVESVVGSEWWGIDPDADQSFDRRVQVISEQPPTLSGEMEVAGTVYTTGKNVVIYAKRVTSLDRAEVDLRPHLSYLLENCPHATNKPEVIDGYLERRSRDLATNVTKIYGRRDVQIAHDLLAHSVVDMPIDGIVMRGWLDISVIGDTRTGKSLTFRRMVEHTKLGVVHAAMDNVSRAGTTLGAGRHGELKPGLLPRQHRKMVILDEWHHLVQAAGMREHPATWFQSARDEGRVHGVKIYGDRALPAKTRFGTIANWARSQRKSFEFAVEHLQWMYGSPEALARMDFALVVEEEPDDRDLTETPHFWDASMCRALILRAWAQEKDQVRVHPDAIELARDLSESWRGKYAHDAMPLYTPEEKAFSILRIATAVANICFAHDEDYYSVAVRTGHVEWAAAWLKHCWKVCGYDTYSEAYFSRQRVDSPFEAERMLTVRIGLNDPTLALSVLPTFRQPFTMAELLSVLGMEGNEAMKWLSRLRQLKVIESKRMANAYNVEFVTTSGGSTILDNILVLAEGCPDEYMRRYKRLEHWSPSAGKPSDMLALNESAFEEIA